MGVPKDQVQGKNLGKVLGNRSMDKACYMELTTNHSEQEEAHKERKEITIDRHNKSSWIIHRGMSYEELERKSLRRSHG